jgi:D-alanyl-D-alanine carboxypeptidase/D-alanyl-D-alanine-endopeptidase (penicillin-binding protein 4)
VRILCFVVALTFSLGVNAQRLKEVRLAIEKLENDPELKNASLSFYALDLDSNQVVASFMENKSLVPASTMKLVTTATALELLGPEKQFSTRIAHSGTIDSNGVLNGNIYIVGGGDPCLGADRFSAHYGDFITNWATAILNLGIDSINGRVIGDASIFNAQLIPSTWIWADLGNYYGAGPCGLSIYENKCQVDLKSGKNGASTEVTCTTPYIPNLSYHNEVKGKVTHKDESYIFGGPYQNKRSIVGSIPINKEKYTVKGSIPDPAYLAAFELDMMLRNKGMKLANPSSTLRKLKLEHINIENTFKKIILTEYSPQLIDIIRLTNFHSINLYAEHLMSQISVLSTEIGDTEKGTEVTTQFWKENKIDIAGMQVSDGSGLSRFNSISSKQLVDILKYMNESKNKILFKNSLPVAGESGTMRNVGRSSAASGNVMAKSGTMTRVKSYAGYVTTKGKNHLAFALIVNNFNCSTYEMKKKIEKIMIKLAEIE